MSLVSELASINGSLSYRDERLFCLAPVGMQNARDFDIGFQSSLIKKGRYVMVLKALDGVEYHLDILNSTSPSDIIKWAILIIKSGKDLPDGYYVEFAHQLSSALNRYTHILVSVLKKIIH